VADVSLGAKQVLVTFDPGQVTVSQMIEAVDRLGFRATLKTPER
jgi:copper chaperone CopZ